MFTTKQPAESFYVSFDFTAALGAETIASATITAVDSVSLVDVTATLLDSTKQSIVDRVVYGWAQGGTNNHSYTITCRIVGSGSPGSIYELEGVLPVEETTGEETPSENDLSSLIAAIQGILQDNAYSDSVLTTKINAAISAIAGGIRMPDGSTSPALPELYKFANITTAADAYVTLPTDYQRKVFLVNDSTGCKISAPSGGDYYSFGLFLKQSCRSDLTETGSVYRVCIKGRKLYYQGIPAAAAALGVHYYRKPTAMSSGTDTPDGIPEHLQMRLIKSFVLKEVYGEMIEAGVSEPSKGMQYHQGQFYEAMQGLCDYVGAPDAEPTYYGGDKDYDVFGSM